MFGVNKSDLLEGLKVVQKRRCGYGGGPKCDCKYGVSEKTFNNATSEQNGCPELSEALRIIQAMTDNEFNRITKRAGIEITSWTRANDEK
jgi:hypothetical protein